MVWSSKYQKCGSKTKGCGPRFKDVDQETIVKKPNAVDQDSKVWCKTKICGTRLKGVIQEHRV